MPAHLLVPQLDVRAGISDCPPLTDPLFIEKQLENNLQDLGKKSQGFFQFWKAWTLAVTPLRTSPSNSGRNSGLQLRKKYREGISEVDVLIKGLTHTGCSSPL